MAALRNGGAPARGPVTPTSDNAQRQPGVEGQGTASRNVAGKGFETARALAALAGFGLHRIAGGYLLTRWGWCREVPTLREVGDWLRRVGGVR